MVAVVTGDDGYPARRSSQSWLASPGSRTRNETVLLRGKTSYRNTFPIPSGHVCGRCGDTIWQATAGWTPGIDLPTPFSFSGGVNNTRTAGSWF
jgi:hypothetical protein